MRAATVVPGKPELAEISELPDPVAAQGELLVAGLLVGVCGTDSEIAHEGFGRVPPGKDRMVLFHESLGRVLSAPPESGFAIGDHVVGVVRRPDPEPCEPCANGQWDFCANGEYTERGIIELDGYGAQRWTVPPEFAVRVDSELGELGVLTEPASVVAKAWDQVDRIGARFEAAPRTALVTGAGPLGLLAALIGTQRGLDVHVLDRMRDGRKPGLVRDLGATYHHDLDAVPVRPDVVIECTGAAELVFDVLGRTARNAIMVLTGISGSEAKISVPGAAVNDAMVLHNTVVVGSVNAGMAHYRAGARALSAADQEWLERLITRRVPLSSWTDALTRTEDDVKVVIDLRQ
ncbi:glucose 1-dehydrogenase [Allokutzneria sp. A3M-2-11 16]|uniref:glucose 1-dehydrogenase n=1 Tax=Allokutzneria sp. A3M-2-11 16 TaxID=2962043 RepID=UPI0020B7BAFB|nr:glucose 1-dehydrogenase [Allokutzneria sp. A3M-2-11 16]MCP3799212.1 glucose 1-dehydrogenase [Allokutzneria sp. A3M-2-11 16]